MRARALPMPTFSHGLRLKVAGSPRRGAPPSLRHLHRLGAVANRIGESCNFAWLEVPSSPRSCPPLPSTRFLFNTLDQPREVQDYGSAVMGAYWFRPGRYARGGMPRMVRWPRKKSDQKSKANTELALAA